MEEAEAVTTTKGAFLGIEAGCGAYLGRADEERLATGLGGGSR